MIKSLQTGFTLIEMLITIAVLAILIGIGVGSYESLFKSNQLRGSNESIHSLIAYAKSESVKINGQVSVNFAAGANGNWCVGLFQVAGGTETCDCNTANSCAIDGREIKLDGKDFNKVTLVVDSMTNNRVVFDPKRGMPKTGDLLGNVVVKSGTGADESSIKIIVNTIGNITQTCKTGSSSSYAACS
ncbi:GspH/FimT family pseudopilin [Motilimonas pumila]|nr:GspH/FimT family pseudopilin [Motilimonas pumila]